MDRLLPVNAADDILPDYRGTPVERLLKYHNLGAPFGSYNQAEMLIGMCMDHRKNLQLPAKFAYVIRSGGANLSHSEFTISYAISVGGVKALAVIGHTNCGMVNVASKKEAFVSGLVEKAGWDHDWALAHFHSFAPLFEISEEIDFVLKQVASLRQRYPKITVAPLLYRVEDNLLYLIKE